MFKSRATQENTKSRGDKAEALALAWLTARGLRLVQANYRVARGPRLRAGEVDLILLDRDGTLVFVEVRSRTAGSAASHGGAAASVGPVKQRRLILAAQHFLRRYESPPPCRFDVLAIDGGQVQWLQGAFDAPG